MTSVISTKQVAWEEDDKEKEEQEERDQDRGIM